MDGKTDGHTDRDGRNTEGRMDRQAHRQTQKLVKYESRSAQIQRQPCGRTGGGLTNNRTDEHTDRETDGYTNDMWTDGRKNRGTDVSVYRVLMLDVVTLPRCRRK